MTKKQNKTKQENVNLWMRLRNDLPKGGEEMNETSSVRMTLELIKGSSCGCALGPGYINSDLVRVHQYTSV